MRLDLFLSSELQISRQKAREMILSGDISLDGRVVSKPSFAVSEDEKPDISVRPAVRYVGRGGIKLAHAIDSFEIDLSGAVCADVGASTGGFTDALLKAGAKLVYAIENGQGQLDQSLLSDSRVVSLEQTDIRNPELAKTIKNVDFAAVDVSFISLKLVIEPTAALLRDNADIVLLIKPQFEAGRKKLSKTGVVRDKKTHIAVVENISTYVKSCGITPIDLVFSPITGGNGNIEYLLHAKKRPAIHEDTEIDPYNTVYSAFEFF